MKRSFLRTLALTIVAAIVSPTRADQALTMVVMDPLALPLSCACVDGVGQRRYEPFAEELSRQLDRDVELIYEESLQLALRRVSSIDLVIGKSSTVLHDALATDQQLHPIASLTDGEGDTTVRGAVLARVVEAPETITNLTGKRVAIGPKEHAECHAAAKDKLADAYPSSIVTHDSIESAVYAFDDGDVDAVVVSGFLPPLLVGCGKLRPDSFRVIGHTAPTPFVQAFVSTAIDAGTRNQIASAIIRSTVDSEIRNAIESESGFVSAGWTDWRGKDRIGHAEPLPQTLPSELEVLWRADLSGPAMAGISATENVVVVADKNREMTMDVMRAFDSLSGKPLWTIEYPAEGKMDYTNAPRATPVIVGDHVILQGVFGDLTCATVANGQIVWQKHLVTDFGGELPSWGYCVPPLVVEEKLIVAPGGKRNAVMALDLLTGETVWANSGHAAAYAPMIRATVAGRDQVIGYDSASLASWDVESGKRLWQLIPPDNTDFNVGTPVPTGNALLLATENNATRVYGFDAGGMLITDPIEVNEDCAPDTCTPVVLKNRVFCSAYGELFCLDADDGFRTVWSQTDDRFYDHTNLIAGNDRVLLWSSSCDLMLLDASADEFKIVSSVRPMANERAESMSHPAIVGDRIYLRSQNEIRCLRLEPDR